MIVRRIVVQYVITDHIRFQRSADDIWREAEQHLADLGCDGFGVMEDGERVNVHGWVTEDVK